MPLPGLLHLRFGFAQTADRLGQGDFLVRGTRTIAVAFAVLPLDQFGLGPCDEFLADAHFLLPVLELTLQPIKNAPDLQLGSSDRFLGVVAEAAQRASKLLERLNRS